jgi:DNA-binding CsgD family transcriptional regulator
LTGGNPLLLRALLSALADEGVVPRAAERARVREVGSRAIWRLVRLRLSRLAPQPRALLGAIAILGDGAAISHAGILAGISAQEVAAAARTLTQTGLLRMDSVLSFAYPLERAAIYRAISAVRREAAHAQAASLLTTEDAPAVQVAAHLLHAPSHHVPFAVDILTDAAQAASHDGAVEKAVAYLRRALREPLTTGGRIDVLLKLAHAEQDVDVSAAARHMHEGLALLSDNERRAQVGLQLVGTLLHAAQPAEALRAFQQAITALALCRHELRSRLQADLVGLTMLRPQLHAIAERQLKAIEDAPAEDAGGEGPLLAIAAFRDACSAHGLASCVDRAEKALADNTLRSSVAFNYACRVLIAADRFEAAVAVFDDALRGARERGSITQLALHLAFRGRLAIDRGALADAEADARAGLDAARAGGVGSALSFSLASLALALLEQGQLQAAAAAVKELASEGSVFADIPFFLLVRAQLRRAEGDADGALATTLRAAEGFAATAQLNPALADWRSHAALAHLDLGDRQAARTIAAEEVGLARAWGAPRALGRALRVAGLAEGGTAGIAMLRESHAVLARSPAKLEHAKTLIELGAAVRRTGHRNEARTLLRSGLDLADACGARPLAQRARRDLRVAGARPRRTRMTGPQALTPSEQRVAAMAVDGMTNREIAQALFVTAKTIEAHLSNTYRKLEINSRMQLARALAQP